MTSKENKVGQTIYEHLQEILNKCIELGWRVNNIDIYKECKIFNDYAIYYMEENLYNKSGLYSYHHLFSKDSGLMERVEWKNKNDGKVLEVIDKKHNLRYVFDDKYMYKHMSYLTAEQKIQYFIDNAIIPKPLS